MRLIILLLLCVSLNLHATWYEVTGSSDILISRDVARKNALEEAIFNALSFSGANLASLAKVRPYLLSKKREYSFQQNDIVSIVVSDEKERSDKLFITARVKIQPMANVCLTNQYKKNVLLDNFHITTPQQASLGGIFAFGQAFARTLNRQIETHSTNFVSQGITPYALYILPAQATQMIAQEHHAQYIIKGNITDLTSTYVGTKLLPKINRELAMHVEVIAANNGDIVYQNLYRGTASWPFERTSMLDTDSARFWRSPYGEMAQQMSRKILVDLEANLSCKLSQANIIEANQEQGHINIGRRHGVKQGDELTLWHHASFIDNLAVVQQTIKQSQIRLRVNQVYDQTAAVEISPSELANSVQIGDLVTKKF